MTTPQKPTVILVCGAYHLPPSFDPLRQRLEARGYPVATPQNPSAGGPPATSSLENDAAHLRALLERLIREEGKQVLLLMHSYGGAVGTFAADGLPRAEGGRGKGLLGLIYMAAFALPPGMHVVEANDDSAPVWVEPVEGEEGVLRTRNAAETLYHDLPPAEQEKYAAGLTTMPVGVFFTPGGPTPWRQFPTTYIFCEHDRAVRLERQKMMVEAMGVEVVTKSLPSSHSPHLSMPDRIVEVVEEAEEYGRRWQGPREVGWEE